MAQLYRNVGIAGGVHWCEQYSGVLTYFVSSLGGSIEDDRTLLTAEATKVRHGEWVCVNAVSWEVAVWTDSGFRQYFRREDSNVLIKKDDQVAPSGRPKKQIDEIVGLASEIQRAFRVLDQSRENVAHNFDATNKKVAEIEARLFELADTTTRNLDALGARIAKTVEE